LPQAAKRSYKQFADRFGIISAQGKTEFGKRAAFL
jgi:hypothetical protein